MFSPNELREYERLINAYLEELAAKEKARELRVASMVANYRESTVHGFTISKTTSKGTVRNSKLEVLTDHGRIEYIPVHGKDLKKVPVSWARYVAIVKIKEGRYHKDGTEICPRTEQVLYLQKVKAFKRTLSDGTCYYIRTFWNEDGICCQILNQDNYIGSVLTRQFTQVVRK